jgi:hypothetical protein
VAFFQAGTSASAAYPIDAKVMIALTVAIHRPFISSDLTMRQVFPHLLILPPAAANIAKLPELLRW